MTSVVDAALRVKGDPSMVFDPRVVTAACEQAGHVWRDRTLDPVRTLEAFAMQITHGNASLAHVVHLCNGRFVESAYCNARQRLPVAVYRSLLRATTQRLHHTDTTALGRWKGHRTYLVDGTGCDMPDTPALQKHFGQPGQQRAGCGFPVAQVVALFDASSRMLIDMVISPLRTRDIAQMPHLHEHLREGDVLLGDRGFCGYSHIALLQQRNMHAIFRVHPSRTLPFPASPGPREHCRSERPALIELISADDQLIEIVKPHNRTPWLSSEQFAAVPRRIVVRVLRYRVERKGARSRDLVLMTTLLDKVKYPASDIAELYKARWQVELNLRDLKQTLGMNSLHSKSVDGVTKEMLMFALVYNAVCAVMNEAARRQCVAVDRISFIDALRWLRNSSSRPDLPTLKVNPRRADRLHPRMLKRRLRYPKLQVAREIWRQKVLSAQLK